MSTARACLCVLFGLPAAGKSRLAEELRSHARGRGWRTLVVTYDELIPAREWRETEWKQHRRTLLMCLGRFLQQTGSDQSDQTHTGWDQTDTGVWIRFEQLLQHQSVSLSDTHSQPLVLLLDDNFYYQSMRQQIQQLARRSGVGFCQVFLRCPLPVCLQRNHLRAQPVPDDVLLQISERMEPPNASRNAWEQQSLTLDSEHITHTDVQKLMDLVASALENPLSPISDESQQKEADRLICASSVLHQADQMCRRLVSQTVTTARDQRASPEELKLLSKELNELKSSFLQDLKREVLQPSSGLSEELDLQRVLAVFEERSQHTVNRLRPDAADSS